MILEQTIVRDVILWTISSFLVTCRCYRHNCYSINTPLSRSLMIDELTINCPKCDHKFALSDTLADPLLKAERAAHEKAIKATEEKLKLREVSFEQEKEEIRKSARKQLDDERLRIAKEEEERARKNLELELKLKERDVRDREDQIAKRDEKLQTLLNNETEQTKLIRSLQEKDKERDLAYQRKLNEDLEKVKQEALAEAREQNRLAMAEKDKRIESLKHHAENMKRKAEQGSQQSQGDIVEVDLEDSLNKKFRFDKIERIKKGVSGADILQTVMSPNGNYCGKILWEIKRTKNWSGSWIAKLKQDQRNKQAEVAVIMSDVIPDEIDGSGQVDGVWVVDYKNAIRLAAALREGLYSTAKERALHIGKGTKMEAVYDYLTGAKFKNHIESIVEKHTALRDDLAKEKIFMHKMWSRREAQIDGVISSSMGMYGDLEGIAGKVMPEIDTHDAKFLENLKILE